MPNESEKEQARAYVRRRLENELSMERNLTVYFETAITRICDVLERYNITAQALMTGDIPQAVRTQINEVISWLIADIYEATAILAVDERDDDSLYLAMIAKEYEKGGTFESRLLEYCGNFGAQITMLYAACRLLDMPSSTIPDTAKKSIGDVYNSDVVTAVRHEKLSYFSPMHFGKGVPSDMSKAITGLTRWTIASAWEEYDYEEAKDKGAYGYWVFRGSTYPCPTCDEAASGYWPIEDTNHHPLLHGNCMCYVVYDFTGEGS